MDVYLIRHAKTAGNLRGCYLGRTDEPLCPEGIAAAESAGVYPAVSRVIVTPLQRTQQTARILFPNAAQLVERDLREMDFGVFEGKTAGEMASDAAYRAWVDGECLGLCPQGESIELFQRRVYAAFGRLIDREIQSGEERVVIVAHGGAIMNLLCDYALPAMGFWDRRVLHCECWKARVDTETWRVKPRFTSCEKLERIDL